MPFLTRTEGIEQRRINRGEELHHLLLLAFFLLAPRRFGQHRADHRLDRREVKGRDPFRELHQPRGEKGIIRDRAEDGLEPVFQPLGLEPLHLRDGAEGAAIPQGHAHPLPG